MALTKIIKSYAYLQYNDDPAIQAFIASFNTMAQNYLDTVNDLNLPNYTQDPVSGALLDWVAEGVYGFKRPVLPTLAVDDDLFRRVITWHYFKGDGMTFDVAWLKRRIWRFLEGTNGVDPGVSATYRVSVIFGANRSVAILVLNNLLTISGGSLLNSMCCNQYAPNTFTAFDQAYPVIPEASILQQAMQSGILELPPFYTFTVTQGGFIETLPLPQMPMTPQPQVYW